MAGTRVQDERWNVSAQVDRAVDRAVNRAVNRVSALAAFRICVGSLLSQALSANGPAPGSDGQPVSKHFLKTPSQPIRKFSPTSRHVRELDFQATIPSAGGHRSHTSAVGSPVRGEAVETAENVVLTKARIKFLTLHRTVELSSTNCSGKAIPTESLPVPGLRRVTHRQLRHAGTLPRRLPHFNSASGRRTRPWHRTGLGGTLPEGDLTHLRV